MDLLSARGAAGSVVGFSSLGIQVCQGLLGYYGSFKDARTDIRPLYSSVERLGGSLKQLAKALSSNTTTLDREMVVESKENIDVLESGLKDLEKRLDKIKLTPKSNSGAWEDFKATGRRALYPLRESTVVKLKEIVDDSLSHLYLILNALQL
jgi:ankyrin repeat domain-containing protein 50